MRHDGLSGTYCIWEMLCCHSDEEKDPILTGQGANRWRIENLCRCRLDFSIIQSFIISQESLHFSNPPRLFFFSPSVIYHFVQGECLSDHCSLCRPIPICRATVWPGERLCTTPAWIPTFSCQSEFDWRMCLYKYLSTNTPLVLNLILMTVKY